MRTDAGVCNTTCSGVFASVVVFCFPTNSCRISSNGTKHSTAHKTVAKEKWGQRDGGVHTPHKSTMSWLIVVLLLVFFRGTSNEPCAMHKCQADSAKKQTVPEHRLLAASTHSHRGGRGVNQDSKHTTPTCPAGVPERNTNQRQHGCKCNGGEVQPLGLGSAVLLPAAHGRPETLGLQFPACSDSLL